MIMPVVSEIQWLHIDPIWMTRCAARCTAGQTSTGTGMRPPQPPGTIGASITQLASYHSSTTWFYSVFLWLAAICCRDSAYFVIQEAKWTVRPSFVRLCKAGPWLPSVQSSRNEMDFTSIKEDRLWQTAIAKSLLSLPLVQPNHGSGELDKAVGDAQIVSFVVQNAKGQQKGLRKESHIALVTKDQT